METLWGFIPVLLSRLNCGLRLTFCRRWLSGFLFRDLLFDGLSCFIWLWRFGRLSLLLYRFIGLRLLILVLLVFNRCLFGLRQYTLDSFTRRFRWLLGQISKWLKDTRARRTRQPWRNKQRTNYTRTLKSVRVMVLKKKINQPVRSRLIKRKN